MAFIIISMPRCEALARVPASLRPSLREHPGRPRAFLLLGVSTWGETLPPPISLDDIERATVHVVEDLDQADELIAKAWGIPIDALRGVRDSSPRGKERTK